MEESRLICRWCGLEVENLPRTDLFVDVFIGDKHCNQAPSNRAERHHLPCADAPGSL